MLFLKNKKVGSLYNKSYIWLFIFILFFLSIQSVSASIYQPGQTLEPDCLPGTSNCGVATFNLNGQSTTTQTLVVGTDGTDFNIASNSGIHTFNLPTASSLNRGLLSSVDWNTFNNKLTSALNTGKIFVGDGSNQASPVTLTGDASLSSSGVFSILDNAITNSKILNGSLSYSKFQDVSANKLLGNPTGGSTIPSEINIGSGLIFSGGTDLKVNSPICGTNERLSWNGTSFECKVGATFIVSAPNSFLAGPSSGGSATSSYRAIVANDIGVGSTTNKEVLLGNQSWFTLFDGSGKINSSVLPSSITGSLKYKGTWNANTNSPALASGGVGGVSGDFYIIDTSGSTTIDGSSFWNVGDWIINASTTWNRIQQGATVSSVNGATGAITLTTDNINQGSINKYFTDTLARNSFTAAGPITLSTTTGNIDCPTCVTTSGNGNLTQGTGVSLSSPGGLSGRLIGSGNVTFSIADTTVTAGSYGGNTVVPTLTVDAQGRLTSAGTTTLDTSVLSSGNLSVARGGTGAGSFTTNGILYGNATGAIQATGAGTSGQFLVANATGIPTFVTASGDVNVATSGLVTINNGAITSGKIADGTITNTDISGSAAIAYSKLNLAGSILNGDIATGTIANNRLANSNVALTLGSSGNDISLSSSTVALGDSLVINIPNASATARGVVSTTTQTFAGDKTFGGTTTFTGNVKNSANFSLSDSIQYSTTGVQNNVNLGPGSFFRYTGNAPATFTGIAGGTDGRVITIFTKQNGQPLTLNDEDFSSAKGTQIITGTEGPIVIPEDNAVMLQYEALENHWHVIAPPSSATSLLAKESFLQNGSAFGTIANLGTTDAYGLNFITGGGTKFGIASSSATLSGSGATVLAGGTTLALTSGSASDLNITTGTTGNLNLDTGTTGAINIGTNSNGKIISIGNTVGGSTLNLNSDGGGINLNGNVTITAGHTFTSGSGINIENSNALSFSATNTVVDMSGSGVLSFNTVTNRPITTGSGQMTVGGDLVVKGNLITPRAADFSTTGVVNDFPIGSGTLYRYTGTGDVTVTGVAGGVDGRIATVMNVSSSYMYFANEDSRSTAGNRMISGTGNSIIVPSGTTVSFQYDAVASRWRPSSVPATSASIASYAFEQNGNAFGSTATLGTNDAFGLNFITGGSTRFGIATTSSTLTGTGATALAGGTTLALTSGSASDLNITTGTTGNLNLDSGSTGAINIGTNSNAKTITLGNLTGATALNLKSGTGGINLTGLVTLGSASTTNLSVANNLYIGSTNISSIAGNNGVSTLHSDLNVTGTTSLQNFTAVNGTTTGNFAAASFSGSAQNLTLARLGNTTFSTLQDMQNVFHSSGWTTGGNITDAGSGNINVAAGTGLLRPANSALATVFYADWPAMNGIVIPTNTIRYIGIEYNGGTPQVTSRTSANWNYKTDFPLGVVSNENGVIHIANDVQGVGDHAATMIQREYETMPLARDDRDGGLMLMESADSSRNIMLSSGVLWDRLTRYPINSTDTSSGGNFDAYTGLTRQFSSQTQWDNTHYNNAGTLATVDAGKYAVIWFYTETDSNLVAVYGTNQYSTLAAATAENMPSVIPERLTAAGKLVGRLIFQKSATVASEVDSAFNMSPFSTEALTHLSNLSGLDFASSGLTGFVGTAGVSGGQTIIGGTNIVDGLTLQSTSATGTTDFIKFLVGTNGGTEAARIIDNGNFGIGTTTPGTKLSVSGAATANNFIANSSGATSSFAGPVTLAGTLNVSGLSSLSTLNTSGLSSLNSLNVSGLTTLGNASTTNL
ncbi:MAG: hypothetical protein WCF92_01345, partial [bacterium]